MTPVTLDDAASPLGTLRVMCSAHGENTIPLISSLTLNPVGRTWEARSPADCLLSPQWSRIHRNAGIISQELNFQHDDFKNGNCILWGDEVEGSIITFQSWSAFHIKESFHICLTRPSHNSTPVFAPHQLLGLFFRIHIHSSDSVKLILLLVGFMNGSITHC